MVFIFCVAKVTKCFMIKCFVCEHKLIPTNLFVLETLVFSYWYFERNVSNNTGNDLCEWLKTMPSGLILMTNRSQLFSFVLTPPFHRLMCERVCYIVLDRCACEMHPVPVLLALEEISFKGNNFNFTKKLAYLWLLFCADL
mgnify:CR=1 FL=1